MSDDEIRCIKVEVTEDLLEAIQRRADAAGMPAEHLASLLLRVGLSACDEH